MGRERALKSLLHLGYEDVINPQSRSKAGFANQKSTSVGETVPALNEVGRSPGTAKDPYFFLLSVRILVVL